MSRILVTGSSGRLGRTVVDVLSGAGHDVVRADRRIPDGEDGYAVDLTDADAATRLFAESRVDALVHLAAIAVPFSAPEDRILATNTALAFNVTRAAIESGVRKIVVASSPTVFGYGSPAGWVPERLPLDEECAERPWNAYALSKYTAERVTRMFAAQLGDSVRFASFRPCYVIAPEEWQGALTQQGHTVRARLDRPELSAPALFNYLDARDAGVFLDRLLEALPSIENAQTFIVGAPDALARQPLAELLPRFIPEAADAASALQGSAPAFSIAKAERMLSWRPERSWRTELAPEAPGVRTDDLEVSA
jgi:nucleoside-diphosphate-sugar epimerase